CLIEGNEFQSSIPENSTFEQLACNDVKSCTERARAEHLYNDVLSCRLGGEACYLDPLKISFEFQKGDSSLPLSMMKIPYPTTTDGRRSSVPQSYNPNPRCLRHRPRLPPQRPPMSPIIYQTTIILDVVSKASLGKFDDRKSLMTCVPDQLPDNRRSPTTCGPDHLPNHHHPRRRSSVNLSIPKRAKKKSTTTDPRSPASPMSDVPDGLHLRRPASLTVPDDLSLTTCRLHILSPATCPLCNSIIRAISLS
ncbi:hypothetical protein ACLOJK_018147, partial [Asimina triloba]